MMQAAIAGLETPLAASLEIMNSNPELRTVMIQSTDRIYVAGSPILTIHVHRSDHAGRRSCEAGKSSGRPFPSPGVVWTAEVSASGDRWPLPIAWKCSLYNFSEKPKAVRPWSGGSIRGLSSSRSVRLMPADLRWKNRSTRKTWPLPVVAGIDDRSSCPARLCAFLVKK